MLLGFCRTKSYRPSIDIRLPVTRFVSKRCSVAAVCFAILVAFNGACSHNVLSSKGSILCSGAPFLTIIHQFYLNVKTNANEDNATIF